MATLSHTKQSLIKELAQAADISEAKAGIVLASLSLAAHSAARKGETFNLPGIGRFPIAERKARKGRNPATGEPIKIKASKVVKFRPQATLRDAAARRRPSAR